MGFGSTWCRWIKELLSTGRASVLVNGSPTGEFQIHRGLRQGDPLSPFLFILAMEGLHIALMRARAGNALRGVSISGIEISHLLYADDVMLITPWDPENANRLLRILRCFYLASGLKINLLKSKLIGVGISFSNILVVANRIGCAASMLPFSHLGIPAKRLSVGGRLTLVKSVLGSLGSYLMSAFLAPISVLKVLESLRARFFWGADIDERRMHWVRWDRVLTSRDDGGLGIGSLFSFNRALIFRWWWRFYHCPDLLWVRVIKSIYGLDGACRNLRYPIIGHGSWRGVVRMFSQLRQKDIDLQSLCPIRVGDGTRTSFWHDVWRDDMPLSVSFPRIYALDLHKHASISDRLSLGLGINTLRRDPRGGAEQEQWSTLIRFLQEFHLRPVPDRLGWVIDVSDNFSIS
ncbi:uncharacterized protein LOC128132862 [Lactuca sativa]|uniref:uncharacterized protein LOC128132862 n=1 Tax=Lactuca sativa TaxID=4236 RepID=UPI0022AFE378|nr:uncharacterized protein LOC128132862 [Lactuca sativa]